VPDGLTVSYWRERPKPVVRTALPGILPPLDGLVPLTPPDERAGEDRAPPPDIPPDIRTLPPPFIGLLTPANDDVRGMLVELLICAPRWPPLTPPAGVEPRGVM
jgi:hypothetical protein